MNVHLTIKDWRSWGITLSAHSASEPTENESTCQPKTHNAESTLSSTKVNSNEIPPMLRRRLSPMGRIAAQCLFPLFDSLESEQATRKTEQTKNQTPIVFASRHGEVARTQKMLSDLATNELLSPTAFSLSVHNAIGGIISIQQKITANITAIAADGSELMATLIEAAGLILSDNANSNDQVLCIICDDPLPAAYQAYCPTPQQAFALAFIIQKYNSDQIEGKDFHALNIQIKSNQKPFPKHKDIAQAAQFTQLLQGEIHSLDLSLGNGHWQVSRRC